VDRRKAEADEAANALRDAEAAVAAAAKESADLRQRARQVDRQLYGGTVRNPQDLLTLQRELEEFRGKLADAEEAELARMEEAEVAEQALRDARTALTTLEEQRAAEAGPQSERLERLRASLAELEARREELRGALPPAHVALYDRVAARRHPAVVRLLGDSCGGCRLPLGMREVHQVRIGQLVQCSNCDRIAAP
jgi:predicted  nucleic acid-binding Zn-ribbon protein